jgi:hypothetical protein
MNLDNSKGVSGNSQGMGGNSQGMGGNSQGMGGNSQGMGGNSQGMGSNSEGAGSNIVIIKAGALFSISSRIGGNNDLTLDESVNVKLYKNAIVNIDGNSYIYGPVAQINPVPNVLSILIATPIIGEKYGGKYQKCFTLPDNAQECASVLYSIMRDADAYCKNKGMLLVA